jgi:hypothetical protein
MRPTRFYAPSGVVFAALILAGCATASKPDAMVPDVVAPVHHNNDAISIAVSGGKETSKMGASQISDEAFSKALSDSIEKSGLFAKVADSGARYRLTGFIGKVDQPVLGFSMTVKMEVSYTLVDAKTGKTVWTKTVASEHTAKPSEAFAGVTRLRLANEGAAKENIRQVVTEISTLNL